MAPPAKGTRHRLRPLSRVHRESVNGPTAGEMAMPTEVPLDAERSPMDSEHHALMTKSRELIKIPRREILELRQEIESAKDTIGRSQKLLSRPSLRRKSA